MTSVAAIQQYRGEGQKATFGWEILSMPLLKEVDQVREKSIAEAPMEAERRWKTCEIVYFGSDLLVAPRMVSSLGNAVMGKPDPVGLHGLGLTSIFSLFTGVITGKRGYSDYEKASKMGDTTGQVMGAINTARGPVEVMGGLTYTPFRALSIAATYTSSKIVGTAALIFGIAGSAFFAGIYVLFAIPSVISLTKNIQFGSKLNGAMDKIKTVPKKLQAALNTLMDELRGSDDERKVFLKGIKDDPAIWHEGRILPFKEVDDSVYTKEELQFLFKEAKELAPDDFSARKLYGHFKERYVNFKAKKNAQMARKTGSESTVIIRQELERDPKVNLVAQLEKGEGVEETQGIIDTVKGEMKKNRLLHAAIIGLCVIYVFALVAGSFTTGGGLAIAVAVVWVVASVGMLAIDGYFLYKSLKAGEMDKKDKIAFFVANILLIMIAGTGMLFSGGLAPIIIGGVMLALWVGIAGYTYYKWRATGYSNSGCSPSRSS